jgi:hypothetical protein
VVVIGYLDALDLEALSARRVSVCLLRRLALRLLAAGCHDDHDKGAYDR